MKVGALNVRAGTGKVRELGDIMVRRKAAFSRDLAEMKQGQQHWRWIQNVLPWCR